MTQLDLLTEWQPTATPSQDPPRVPTSWETWLSANAHVLAELLRLARAELDRGVTFLSVKGIWETARARMSASKSDGYKLNNNHTANAARWLIAQEPRLDGVIRIRGTKS